jgi:hypothetical protein
MRVELIVGDGRLGSIACRVEEDAIWWKQDT